MIKRAEAEEAIEVLDILKLMAGKIFAVPVLEKTAGILLHNNPQYMTTPGTKAPGARRQGTVLCLHFQKKETEKENRPLSPWYL